MSNENSPQAKQIDYAWKIHTYTNDYIRFADAKAGAVIALAGGLIGGLYVAKAHNLFMVKFQLVLGLCSIAAFLLLIASIMTAIMTIRPRLKTNSPKGLIYWNSVISYQTGEYLNTFKGSDEEELLKQILLHVHILARIASEKYAWLNPSIILLVIGALLGGGVLLFV